MSLTITRKNGSLFVFDATINYSTTWDNEITSHPVESGSNISDHIINQSVIIDFEGIITDSSINKDISAIGDSAAANSILYDMWRGRETFDLTVDNRKYSDMTFKSLNIPKDVSLSSTLKVTGQIQQINIVSNATTSVPAIDRSPEVKDSASDKSSKGANKGKAVDDDTLEVATELLVNGSASLLRGE